MNRLRFVDGFLLKEKMKYGVRGENMDDNEWMKQRHSVRVYDHKPLDPERIELLQDTIDRLNKESGQHFQLVVNDPEAFTGTMAKYGHFSGVVNYVALVGNDEEKVGYFGEELVKVCTEHGLKTCWVCLTFKKNRNQYSIDHGEKLFGVIAVGTSDLNGSAHLVKPIEKLCEGENPKPDWFMNGMRGVQLAPSALNQQKYRFSYENGTAKASSGLGFYMKIDLGIAKYHFDQASGKDLFRHELR